MPWSRTLTASAALVPRFPHVPPQAGHYESTYLVANSPEEPVAVWIRYTVHQPPCGPLTGSVWITVFEPSGPTAAKVTDGVVRTDHTELLAVGQHGSIGPDRAHGQLSGDRGQTAWDLRFEPTDTDLWHLPHRWMYGGGVPRTKSTSPYPAMLVSGTVSVPGRELHLDRWPGMLGHNWGAEHAHRWIWLRGASFAGLPDAWLDVVIGRVKIGPAVLPWIANGALALEGPAGQRLRVGGLGRAAKVVDRPDGCNLVLPGRAVSLKVSVAAPLARTVGWEYADPTGGRHQVRNCSTAGVAVELMGNRSSGGGDSRRLVTEHGGVYELGTADFDPAVPMQPFTD